MASVHLELMRLLVPDTAQIASVALPADEVAAMVLPICQLRLLGLRQGTALLIQGLLLLRPTLGARVVKRPLWFRRLFRHEAVTAQLVVGVVPRTHFVTCTLPVTLDTHGPGQHT